MKRGKQGGVIFDGGVIYGVIYMVKDEGGHLLCLRLHGLFVVRLLLVFDHRLVVVQQGVALVTATLLVLFLLHVVLVICRWGGGGVRMGMGGGGGRGWCEDGDVGVVDGGGIVVVGGGGGDGGGDEDDDGLGSGSGNAVVHESGC